MDLKKKRWQKEKFAKLIDMLILEMNAKAILFGGINEIELSKDIENLCTKNSFL